MGYVGTSRCSRNRLAAAGASGDKAKIAALREEWRSYCGVLHRHPGRRGRRTCFRICARSTRRWDPCSTASAPTTGASAPCSSTAKRAFGELPAVEALSVTVVAALSALLQSHLATEEAAAIPLLRPAKQLPATGERGRRRTCTPRVSPGAATASPPTSSRRVYAMLPEMLRSRLPAAPRRLRAPLRERVWGTTTPGASRTAIPDWLLAPG